MGRSQLLTRSGRLNQVEAGDATQFVRPPGEYLTALARCLRGQPDFETISYGDIITAEGGTKEAPMPKTTHTDVDAITAVIFLALIVLLLVLLFGGHPLAPYLR